MLKPSEIISAQALVVALKQQSDLPAEIQTKFQSIGKNLQTNSSYFNRSIQDCVDLIRTYEPLETLY
jgi:phosphoenolpyruvate carboxylase